MTTTMQLIGKQTVGAGGAASVTFSNIPQTYTDLKVVASARSTYSNPFDVLIVYYNGSTTNQSMIELYGYNGSTASGTDTKQRIGYISGSTATASTFGSGELYIPNYTSSNNKSSSADGVSENNSALAVTEINANLWSSSAAITSMTLYALNGNLVEFSEFTLYGISNSTTTQATTVPYASGGDVITTDGTYWYHAFKYSGSFTPLKNLTADVLVVAGGGGGASGGGGGGAGGLLGFTAQALISATNYTCTVGSGGVGSSTTPVGTNGNDSQFGSLTLVKGGGRGAGGTGYAANSGGSGGGGVNGAITGGAATSGQGNAGGTSDNTGGNAGAGGGGAGAVGTTNSGVSGGAGGIGVSTYSSWATATSTGASGYFAGGGGGGGGNNGTGSGGTGGTGGGGSGSAANQNTTNGTAGTANTGGGGGGGGTKSGVGSSQGAAGGSGIIIIRYPV